MQERLWLINEQNAIRQTHHRRHEADRCFDAVSKIAEQIGIRMKCACFAIQSLFLRLRLRCTLAETDTKLRHTRRVDNEELRERILSKCSDFLPGVFIKEKRPEMILRLLFKRSRCFRICQIKSCATIQ